MRICFCLIMCFVAAPVLETSAAPFQEKETDMIFEPPQHHFTATENNVDILHITDEDEYLLEWKSRLETARPSETQEIQTILFEDGYVKDNASAWSKQQQQLSSVKQTASEDSSRYDVLSYYAIKKASVFSFDWRTSSLYVFDTPMTDLHSFQKPKTEEEKKSKQMMDTILRQQQNHIKRRIRDKAELPETAVLFPLYEWKEEMHPPISALSPAALEKVWLEICGKLVEETEKHGSNGKKTMPFLSWDDNSRKLSLYIHYGNG